MTDEVKRNRKIIMITVFAALFFVLMLTALIMNLVRIASLSSREKALKEQLEAINAQIENNRSEIDYRKTDEYVDSYAREYLGMIGEGEIAFTDKDK